MLILNDRALGDKGVGQTTCKDNFVVDYVICTSYSTTFCQISKLKNFVHFIQTLIMRSNSLLKVSNVIPTQATASSRSTLGRNKIILFLENLNQSKVNEILNTLNDKTQPNKASINAIMFEIEDLFTTTCNNAFSKQKVSHYNDKTSINSKPWFNNKFRQPQQKYHLARRIFNINTTHQDQRELLASSKSYKREIIRSITNYKRMMRNKFRQIKKKTSKIIWKNGSF